MSLLKLALTALTGGGPGALDKIDGAGLNDGDAAVVVLSTGVYHYHLNETSGASENAPYVITPDNNPGTKRWILVTPQAPFSHVKVNIAADQNLTNAIETLINFDTVVYDYLSEYNTTSKLFKAKSAGLYNVGVYLYYGADFDINTERLFCVMKLNGTIDHYMFQDAGLADASIGSYACNPIELAKDDEISMYANQNSGSGITITSGSTTSFYSIDRIA